MGTCADTHTVDRTRPCRSQIAGSEMPFVEQPHLDMFSDLVLIIDEHYQFYVHEAFMCTRTEYFAALVKNHFNEMLADSTEPAHRRSIMPLKHIRKELFLPLLYYIYSDECEVSIEHASGAKDASRVSLQIPNDCVDDLLVLADELLLPGLKRLCGNTYSKLLTVETIMATIRLARLFELVKLEHHCIRFISDHLSEVSDARCCRCSRDASLDFRYSNRKNSRSSWRKMQRAWSTGRKRTRCRS